MESRFKLTMRTWDDVWKSTAWAKFAPDKLKQTLQRSSRNNGELKSGSGAAGEMGAGDTTAVAVPTVAPVGVQVKKSRFRVVPHVQIDDQPAVAVVHAKRSSPKPPLSSSSGSSDTDSDRLPAGLPMIESNLNELTMVESELKKLEREHVAKHQLLTPKSNGDSTEKTLTADDGAVTNDGRKQQQHQQQRAGGGVGDGKKDKSPKVGSRAAETHSKRLGWLKAFRRKSSADTSSESSAPSQPAAAPKTAKHKQQAKSSSAGGRQSSSSSPRQQQKQRAAAARLKQQRERDARATAVLAAATSASTPVSHHARTYIAKSVFFFFFFVVYIVCVYAEYNIGILCVCVWGTITAVIIIRRVKIDKL